MGYTELVESLRICGKWGTEVRIPGEPSECDGCIYHDTDHSDCKSWDADGRKEKILLEAADAIEELQKQIDGWIDQERKALLKSVPKWIPVEERLPEPPKEAQP